MQKVEAISASGNIRSVVEANFFKIAAPGTVVKVSLSKNEISGAQKKGNDLLLIKTNGESLLLEDFFVVEGTMKNKLVVEDSGELYLAEYNAENFSGLEFVSVSSIDEVLAVSQEAGASPAVWLVPLLGAAAIGAGVAIYNNKGSSKNHSSGDHGAAEKQALENASKALDSKTSALDSAQKQLDSAQQAMKKTPDSQTVEAVEEAKTALQKAAEALNTAATQHQTAINNAKEKGVDTTAEQVKHQQAGKSISDASQSVESAGKAVDAAKALISASSQQTIAQVQESIASARSIIEKAKTVPTEQNMESVSQYQEQAEKSLTELKGMIDTLNQAIQTAQEQGIDVTASTALLDSLQSQYEKDSKAISEALSAAQQNKQDLDASHAAVTSATQAVDNAVKLKETAAKQLTEALALKAGVLENNQLDKIDEVNTAIKEANAALETARQAAEAANIAAVEANQTIDKLDAGIDASLKPSPVSGTVDVSDLNTIDKGVQAETYKSFMEAIGDYAQKFIDSLTGILKQISDSKPGEIIKGVVDTILNGIVGYGEILADKICAVVESVKTVFTAIGEIAKSELNFFGDMIKLGIETVKDVIAAPLALIADGIGAVMSGIGKAVTDAVSGMGIFDWLCPAQWLNKVIIIVTNSITNIYNNVSELVKSIPGKISDMVIEKLSSLGDAFGTKFSGQFSAIKTAVEDVAKSLFEAFIEAPIQKIISPLISKITELMSNPFESLTKLVADIGKLFADGISIIKSFVELPGKIIDATGTLICDVINSFKADKVIDGNGDEISEIIEEVVNDLDVESMINTEANNGEINLDNLVPATVDESIAPVDAAVIEPMIETYAAVVVTDESFHSSVMAVAA